MIKILNSHRIPSTILFLGLWFGYLNTACAATDCSTVTDISQMECESLLQFYHQTDGANWYNNEGWNVSNEPCQWRGITCDNNSVVEISLRVNLLKGQMPDLTGLPNLQKLFLNHNQLRGTFSDLAGLDDLQEIHLDNNQFTGEIPDLRDWPGLPMLSIRGNQFTGSICNLVTEISPIECESLLQLYHSTDGANWIKNDSWNITNIPCSWHGITCENDSVVEIKLSGKYTADNNLVGTIPDFIGLPNLRTLFMSENFKLTGEIPNFSGLPSLQTLNLERNKLIGEIPDFSQLSNLQTLNLEWNKLSGTIPDFSQLPNLQTLSLSNNELSGLIPDFSQLPNLQILSLSGNQLTGLIPDFSQLPNLQILSLSGNQLTGLIPDFSYLPNLQTFSLFSKQLTGPIPDFSHLPNLQALSLSSNQRISKQLTWSIPDFSHLPNLQALIISSFGEQLTGPIPDFSHLPNLQTLYLRWNKLTGPIPDFSGLPNLQKLDLRANNLTGSIPNFSNLPDLQYLDLHYNQLKEPIPNFDLLPNLQFFNGKNRPVSKIGGPFTGCNAVKEISQVECESLLQLYHSTDGDNWRYNEGWKVTDRPCHWYGITCENNGVVKITLSGYYDDTNELDLYVSDNLVGTIPDFHGLPHLQTLSLKGNKLTGTIPDFSHIPNLQELDLGRNQLTGTIPDFSHVPNLQELDFGGNQLTGTIPDFSNVPYLQSLNLSENQLTGSISDFSHLPNLKTIIFENNKLTGQIPDFSHIPNLQILALNDNKLTGRIPDFSALPNLVMLYLKGNQLTGLIPNFDGSPHLLILFLDDNQPRQSTNCSIVKDMSQMECDSLLQLYHNTGDWDYNHGWNVTNTPCLWAGITCENSEVVKIDLDYAQLTGKIPNFIGLPNLRELSLEWNNLTGSIPNFSGLANLQHLDLSFNQLTGTLPNFNGMPNLRTLGFDGNQLEGTIPNFSNFPNLQEIYLYENQLTGTLPDFGGMPNLRVLHLSDNQLEGAIPDFNHLPNLQTLYFDENRLTGTLPHFSASPNLKELRFQDNQLTSENHSANIYLLLSGEQFKEYSSFVRITNITRKQITVSATLRDETGQVLGQADAPILTLGVRATGVLSMLKLQGLLNSPDWNGVAWLEVSAPVDSIRVMNMLRSPTTLTDLSLVENKFAYNLPSSTNQQDEMYLILANPTDDSMLNITATVYNKEGVVQGGADRVLAAELAPKSMKIITASMLEQLMGSSPWTGRGWLEITSSHKELKLMNLLMSKSSATITNMSRASDKAINNLPGTTNGNGDTAFIRMINTTGETREVRGTLHHQEGHILGNKNSVLVAALAPYSIYSMDMADLEAKIGTAPWTKRARLILTAPSSGVKLAATIRSPSGTVTNTSVVSTTNVLYNVPGSINGNKDIGFVRITNTNGYPVPIIGVLYHMNDMNAIILGRSEVTLIDSLPPAGTKTLSITQLETLFGTTPWTGRARLVITSPTNNIELMMMVRTKNGTLTNLSGVVGN